MTARKTNSGETRIAFPCTRGAMRLPSMKLISTYASAVRTPVVGETVKATIVAGTAPMYDPMKGTMAPIVVQMPSRMAIGDAQEGQRDGRCDPLEGEGDEEPGEIAGERLDDVGPEDQRVVAILHGEEADDPELESLAVDQEVGRDEDDAERGEDPANRAGEGIERSRDDVLQQPLGALRSVAAAAAPSPGPAMVSSRPRAARFSTTRRAQP